MELELVLVEEVGEYDLGFKSQTGTKFGGL